jgi:hypothetical protein
MMKCRVMARKDSLKALNLETCLEKMMPFLALLRSELPEAGCLEVLYLGRGIISFCQTALFTN